MAPRPLPTSTSPARRWITRAGTGRVPAATIEPGALPGTGGAHPADDRQRQPAGSSNSLRRRGRRADQRACRSARRQRHLMAYVYPGVRGPGELAEALVRAGGFGFTDWTPVDTPAAQDIDCTNNFETWIYRDGRQCTDSGGSPSRRRSPTADPVIARWRATRAAAWWQSAAAAAGHRDGRTADRELSQTRCRYPPVLPRPSPPPLPVHASTEATSGSRFNGLTCPAPTTPRRSRYNVSAAPGRALYRLGGRNPFGGAVTCTARSPSPRRTHRQWWCC